MGKKRRRKLAAELADRSPEPTPAGTEWGKLLWEQTLGTF